MARYVIPDGASVTIAEITVRTLYTLVALASLILVVIQALTALEPDVATGTLEGIARRGVGAVFGQHVVPEVALRARGVVASRALKGQPVALVLHMVQGRLGRRVQVIAQLAQVFVRRETSRAVLLPLEQDSLHSSLALAAVQAENFR